MWVKICANTNVEDAVLAARLGADAVGFVFAPSSRQVTVEQVAAITPHLPADVERVGVFTDSPPVEIARAVEAAGLTAVQLHSFRPDAIEELMTLVPDSEIIPVVRWEVASSAAGAAVERDLELLAKTNRFRRVLVDAKIGSTVGGNGVPFDWIAAQAIFLEQKQRGTALILAGGLRPENVGDAIRAMQPWGVDVASGVEASPGRKDPARLELFVQRAHGG